MTGRLIDWTLAHPRVMWAFVGSTFIIMLFIQDARWNAITTVWGALFLGLLISLVLEQRGEGIQRRVWLRQNADRAATTVDGLLAAGAYAAAFAVDLPRDITKPLMSGRTRSVRREAAEHARAHIVARGARTQLAPMSDENAHMPSDDLLRYARQAREARERHAAVLSRVTELDTAVDRFLDALRWYEEAEVAKENPRPEDVRAVTKFFLVPIGEAAVGLCEACADLLVEARLLSQ